MASDRQITANRRNAKRSTGPKTDKGKAKSSGNALKHGLTGQRMLLDGEDAELFETFCEQLQSELKPVGIREQMCVDQLAQTRWRLMRCPGYEAAILEWKKRGGNHAGMIVGEEMLAGSRPCDLRNALLAVVLPTDALAKLARHEAHLARQVQEVLEQLDDLQKERLAAAAAAEAALSALNLGLVTTALIAPPAAPFLGKLIEREALVEPQAEKAEPPAPKSASDLPEG
jgi:hypothetical protein